MDTFPRGGLETGRLRGAIQVGKHARKFDKSHGIEASKRVLVLGACRSEFSSSNYDMFLRISFTCEQTALERLSFYVN